MRIGQTTIFRIESQSWPIDWEIITQWVGFIPVYTDSFSGCWVSDAESHIALRTLFTSMKITKIISLTKIKNSLTRDIYGFPIPLIGTIDFRAMLIINFGFFIKFRNPLRRKLIFDVGNQLILNIGDRNTRQRPGDGCWLRSSLLSNHRLQGKRVYSNGRTNCFVQSIWKWGEWRIIRHSWFLQRVIDTCIGPHSLDHMVNNVTVQ